MSALRAKWQVERKINFVHFIVTNYIERLDDIESTNVWKKWIAAYIKEKYTAYIRYTF